MKLGIIIHSSDAETTWNAFRLANLSLTEKDEVKIFLLAKGVEYENLSNEKFNIFKLAQDFVNNNGKILACGTCLKLRQKEGTELCPLSSLKDLYKLVEECDKVLTF
ncbi:MAG: DsrE family protein [Elusimicrobia bacterium]|nr:DsrE family protein [Elusimicrobiota bacterium]